MLDLDDSRWTSLKSAYRAAFDPRAVLLQLQASADVDAAWKQLWDDLHHQGNVDTAAYACAPHLVRIHGSRDLPDWNTYAILGVIELARRDASNAPISSEFKVAYNAALEDAIDLGLRDLGRSRDKPLVQSVLGLVALVRGLTKPARAPLLFTENEFGEMLSGYSGLPANKPMQTDGRSGRR
jgi:hypothetical protein